MRDALIPAGSSTSPSRLDRKVAHQLAVIQADASLQTARQVARLEGITLITEEALLCAAEVSQAANMLAERSPFAMNELAFIAKAGIAAMGDVVIRSGRSVR